MRLICILAMFAVCSCTNETPEVLNNVDIGKAYIGLNEVDDRSELKTLLEVDPVRVEWCAAFVNAILKEQGTPNLYDIEYKYPLTARGFLHWGDPMFYDEIKKGDIVVFPRGSNSWQGHVGFYVGSYGGKWVILGGNQDNTVSYKMFDPIEALGVRRATTGWQETLINIDLE